MWFAFDVRHTSLCSVTASRSRFCQYIAMILIRLRRCCRWPFHLTSSRKHHTSTFESDWDQPQHYNRDDSSRSGDARLMPEWMTDAQIAVDDGGCQEKWRQWNVESNQKCVELAHKVRLDIKMHQFQDDRERNDEDAGHEVNDCQQHDEHGRRQFLTSRWQYVEDERVVRFTQNANTDSMTTTM